MAPRQSKSSTKRRTSRPRQSEDWLFPTLATQSDVGVESSLLDVVDNVLNKGMVINGDLILGVANVDLIYVKLSALLAALDKVTDGLVFHAIAAPSARKRKRKKR